MTNDYPMSRIPDPDRDGAHQGFYLCRHKATGMTVRGKCGPATHRWFLENGDVFTVKQMIKYGYDSYTPERVTP